MSLPILIKKVETWNFQNLITKNICSQLLQLIVSTLVQISTTLAIIALTGMYYTVRQSYSTVYRKRLEIKYFLD